MNVLIIDDHDLFSEGLMLLLQSIDSSLTVDFVSSHNQAMELQERDKIELILLDYHLADASGAIVLNKIRKHFPLATIVTISSDDSPSAIYSSISHGASGYIPKSSSRSNLIAALKLVLNGETYLPPHALNTATDSQSFFNNHSLTDRQVEVLTHAVKGTANKVIAAELDIAEGTVKAHLFAAFKAMGVNNRTEAVVAFAQYQSGNISSNIINP